MHNDLILSIDLGTTFIKGLVVDRRLDVVEECRYRIHTEHPQTEMSEQDPNTVLQYVEKILRKLNSSSRLPIVFTNAMHSLILLDRDYSPLSPVIIWADTRANAETRAFLQKFRNNSFYWNTGVPAHPMLPTMKAIWFREHKKKLFDKLSYLVSLKDWIIFKLSGNLITEHSTAASMGCYDLKKSDWNQRLLSSINIPAEFLPQIKPVDNMIDSKWGKIIVGATDGPMANYFVNHTHGFEHSMVGTIGTSAAVRFSNHSPHTESIEKGIFSYPVHPDFWVVGLASNNGGNVIEWFNKNYLGTQVAEKELYTWLPDKDDPVINPFIFNERPPLWDKIKVDFDQEFNSYSNHPISIYYVYEAIFLNLKRMISELDSINGPSKPKKMVISGGIFHDDFLSQLLSNILQIEIVKPKSVELSGLGAALLGFRKLDHNQKILPRFDYQLFTPDIAWKTLAKDRFEKFMKFIK